MSKFLFVLPLAVLLSAPAPAIAYDDELAMVYHQLFSQLDEKKTAKLLQFKTAQEVMEAIGSGKPICLMDVRTEREQALHGLTFPDTLHLPMNRVFTYEGLASIPKDRPVVVTSECGARCAAVAMALRDIGFKNVFVMKGGLTALMAIADSKSLF